MLSAGATAFTSLSGQTLGLGAEMRGEIGGLRVEMREEIAGLGRIAADRRQIEEAAASEQRRLGENLRAVANGALRTIESDTAVTVARVRVMLLNAWLRPPGVGLSLFLAFSGGSWGLMHWLSSEIQSRIETLAMLEVRIDQGRGTLVEIEDTTWDVTLRVIDGGGSWCCRTARWRIRRGPWAGGLP